MGKRRSKAKDPPLQAPIEDDESSEDIDIEQDFIALNKSTGKAKKSSFDDDNDDEMVMDLAADDSDSDSDSDDEVSSILMRVERMLGE
jgi:hypothetical protein